MSSVLKLASLCFAAAVLAVVARYFYTGSQAQAEVREPEIQVRVAAADLPAGLLLRDTDLVWKALPKSDVPDGAFAKKKQTQQLPGSLLRHAVSVDGVITANNLIRPDAPGFLAAALKPGKRAVSVSVDAVSSNAGLVQPGDYVDIILTQQLGKRSDFARGDRKVVSETVVEHARIIAVGSSFQREAKRAGSRVRTVTLEVGPQAAEAVIVASQLGHLSLALRSFAVSDPDAAGVKAESEGARVVAWDNQPLGHHIGPIWGRQVSRALQGHRSQVPSGKNSEPKPNDSAGGRSRTRKITIIRGNNVQEKVLGSHAR